MFVSFCSHLWSAALWVGVLMTDTDVVRHGLRRLQVWIRQRAWNRRYEWEETFNIRTFFYWPSCTLRKKLKCREKRLRIMLKCNWIGRVDQSSYWYGEVHAGVTMDTLHLSTRCCMWHKEEESLCHWSPVSPSAWGILHMCPLQPQQVDFIHKITFQHYSWRFTPSIHVAKTFVVANLRENK